MMSTIGGTFWSTFRNFQNSSALDEILDKETTTLTDVLNDDEVIQEMKNHSQKLIDL